MINKRPFLEFKTVLVAPVGPFCNLQCSYCYHTGIRRGRVFKKMSRPILKEILRGATSSAWRIKFLFHGGEPLLAGKDFYSHLLAYQKEERLPKQQIKNHIQTNATLIDDRWAKFFYSHRIRISISLDGPAEIHNKNRYFPNTQGSFKQVLKGIKAIKKYGDKVGIIITIHRDNVNFPEEVWKEIIFALGSTGFEINICAETDTGIKDLIPDAPKVINFLTRIFDLWFDNDDPTIYIRLFANALKAMMGGFPNTCSFRYNRCRDHVAVDENGNVFPCGRFLDQREVYMGNVLETPLDIILKSRRAKEIYDATSMIKKECFVCEWLRACGGGCAYQRWLPRKRFDDHFPQCEIRKGLFAHIKKRIT